MSYPFDAATCSPPTIPSISTPGAPGQSSYSILQSSLALPSIGSTVTVTVDSVAWMVIGQTLIVGQGNGTVLGNPGPATFLITAIPSATTVTLKRLGYPGDITAGSIDAGALLSPAGALVLPRGTATLVAGTVTVSAAITANSIIQATRNTSGGTPGHLAVPAASRNVGAGTFVISSSSASDTSTVDWVVIG